MKLANKQIDHVLHSRSRWWPRPVGPAYLFQHPEDHTVLWVEFFCVELSFKLTSLFVFNSFFFWWEKKEYLFSLWCMWYIFILQMRNKPAYKGGWMKPTNKCSLTQSLFNSFFLLSGNCSLLAMKQGRETNFRPLIQEMTTKEEASFCQRMV